MTFFPSIDFTGEPRPEGNLAESATLRLVQELDTRGEQHEPGEQSFKKVGIQVKKEAATKT